MLDSSTARRETGDDRRIAIALAARGIILEKGLEGLRTRDIAARVGINIATLHYHVPTKAALIELVAESLRADFRARMLRRPRDGKTGLEQLRLQFDDFRDIIAEAPELLVVLTEMIERGRRDPVIGAIMAPMSEAWRRQFVDIYRAGVADGSFRADIDPVAAALITTAALADCRRQWTEFRVPLEDVRAELERAFAAPPSPTGPAP